MEVQTPQKVYLDVSYQDKDQVKALGALWSPAEKRWYVSQETDLTPFQQWLPQAEETVSAQSVAAGSIEAEQASITDEPFNIKAITPFYLLTAVETCKQCQKETQVVAIASEGIEEQGESQQGFVRFNFVEHLPDRLTQFIQQNFAQYQLTAISDRASGQLINCYSNHCQHCNAVISDSVLHSEPSHAFYPITPQEAKKIEKLELKSSGKVKLTAATAYSAPDLISQFAQHSLYQPED